ncbi:hypothetical protein ACFQY4_26205 [Catellatospora bangladeshensis]
MLSALPDTMTVLIVEHDPAVAARITTTTLQLNAGQPTAEGGPA